MAKYPDAVSDTPPAPRRRRWWGMLGRNLPGLSIVLMATLLLGIVLWPYMVITVTEQSGRRCTCGGGLSFDTICGCGCGTMLIRAN